jgi:hypothetical protein
MLEAVNDAHSIRVGMVAHDKYLLADPRLYDSLHFFR